MSFICLLKHKWETTIMLMRNGKGTSRFERKCKRCSVREIQLAQFKKRVQGEIRRHFETTKDYYRYKKGDWLDTYTTAVLVSHIDEE